MNNTGEIEEQACNSRYKESLVQKEARKRKREGGREEGRDGGRGEGRCNLALLESPAPSCAVDPIAAVWTSP